MKHVLVPRFADFDNYNAQNQNARSLVRRFKSPFVSWSMIYHHAVHQDLFDCSHLRFTKLLPRHLWKPHLAFWYQQNADAIFYPGPIWADDLGLSLRRFSGRRIPLISTLEGLVGNPDREKMLSDWAGHRVFCQRIDDSKLRRIDRIYRRSDHIIAISPFLAQMGRKLYGDKVSMHMLGTEGSTFRARTNQPQETKRVVNIANLNSHKRPEMYFRLAARYPGVEFCWYGGGDRLGYMREVENRGLRNLKFPGPVTTSDVVEQLQSAYMLAIPSNAEGVPKVTQEAASVGLPIVAFGYYEAPTVTPQNGFVAWNDDEFIKRVGELLANQELARSMGQASAQLAKGWDWDHLAPQWEQEILRFL